MAYHRLPLSLEGGNPGENENTKEQRLYFLRKTEKGSNEEDRVLKLRDFILPKEILTKVQPLEFKQMNAFTDLGVGVPIYGLKT